MHRTFRLSISALTIGVAMLSTAAMADDPRDPRMRSAAARAKDSADTKRLNEGQLAHVRERDGKIMSNYRRQQNANDAAYATANAEYERKMAAWRHAVAACKAGSREYCDN